MKRTIKNHNIKNLADLNQRQDALQDNYADLEKEIIDSIFSPVKIAGLAFSIIGGRNKKRKENKTQLLFNNKEKTLIVEKPKGQRFLKSIVRSWIRWQAFNLAFFLGKKSITFIKERRKRDFNQN